MATLYHFPDHAPAARGQLLEVDRARARMVAWLNVESARDQALEDSLWDMHEGMWLNTATGAQLDMLGAIVGEARQGRDDTTYRLWVKARARANRSSGTPNDALAVLSLVLESTATIEYIDESPRDAVYRIYVAGTSVDLVQVRKLLELTKPAGVQLDLVYSPPDAFRFDIGPGLDVGHFSDVV